MDSTETKKFKFVDYLWDDSKAAKLKDDEVEQLIYRSNILGADLRITNYGGGNTSCKTMEPDPLTGESTEVMWVKGSGGDLGTLKRSGLAGLYMDRLHALKNIYKGLEYEDEMVELYNHCIFDLDSKAPSIDTALHAFLPFKHIDHLHPDAGIAIAAAKNSKELTEELFNGELGWVPWQRPGFDLGIQLEECVKQNPGIKGIVLENHGLFTWGDTSYECYMNSLEVIEKCSEYLEDQIQKNGKVFGGQKINPLGSDKRKHQAAKLAPVLRGLCSSERHMIGYFTDDERVLEFIDSNDLGKLAPMGTSCPDHFLRTKIFPLVLELPADIDLTDADKVKEEVVPAFEKYREDYKEYYEKHKRPDSPPMRDANPVVILWPGVGMFTFAKNKQTARVASEFYVNAINVMRGAEAVSEYTSLPTQEAFDIEYWQLEEAKLKRMPKPKALSGKIAIITGAGGGIGKAIAHKLSEEGACVVLTDSVEDRLKEAIDEFAKDAAAYVKCDVTDEKNIESAYDHGSLKFGGVDIIVNCAGLAISKSLKDTSLNDWNLLQDVLVKGQFLMSKYGVEILKKQSIGGDIVNIASKNALMSGPNNVGYGSAKAAQVHMSRLLAAELGGDKIRVNVVNPDAVIEGSKIWEGEWAQGRAKAYGIDVKDLPAHYAKRTLLNEIIRPSDIAEGVYAFVNGNLSKSTGNILNVDGGVSQAFVR